MARHIIMDSSGHSVIDFDPSNTTDIAKAKRRFEKLIAKGFLPAERKSGGKHHVPNRSERVFNPDAEETLFIPSLRGG